MILIEVGLPMSKDIILNSGGTICRNLSNYLMICLTLNSTIIDIILGKNAFLSSAWNQNQGGVYLGTDKGKSELSDYFKNSDKLIWFCHNMTPWGCELRDQLKLELLSNVW